VEGHPLLVELGLSGGVYAASIAGGDGLGFNADGLMAPASVMPVTFPSTGPGDAYLRIRRIEAGRR
jgi:hypothetical protein